MLLASGTITTSGTGPVLNLVQGWQSAIVVLNFSTVSGTNPTLNVYLQRQLPQAASTDTSGSFPTGTFIYDDLLSFSQQTTSTGTRVCNIVSTSVSPTANATAATTADYAQSDAALTAGSLRMGPLGGWWRVKYVVGGTGSPTFTAVSVVATMIPMSN